MNKILIVEDDTSINEMIRDTLSKKGIDCVQAFSGTEAILQTNMNKFDVIILDLMLAGLSGEQVLQKVREKSKTPIIILSAKDELDSKVDLLTMGADDYITKPCDIKELVARVSVWLRRNSDYDESSSEIISHNGLTINKTEFSVTVNNHEITLTKQEFKILELLLTYPNKVFSKQEIYDYAWEEYYIGVDKTINVHISNIRAKIKKYSDKEYIETVWGIGFKAL